MPATKINDGHQEQQPALLTWNRPLSRVFPLDADELKDGFSGSGMFDCGSASLCFPSRHNRIRCVIRTPFTYNHGEFNNLRIDASNNTPLHLGLEQTRIKTLVLGHSLVRLLVRSHRSLVRSLRTARFARALRCAHSFARSLTSLTPSAVGQKMAFYSMIFFYSGP